MIERLADTIHGFREAVDTAKAFADRTNEGRGVSAKASDIAAPTQDSSGKQLTRAQSKYFAKSVVRDVQGRLLKLYHGSESRFDTFEIFNGVWMSTERDCADETGFSMAGKCITSES